MYPAQCRHHQSRSIGKGPIGHITCLDRQGLAEVAHTRGCRGWCRAVGSSCRAGLCCSMPSRLRWSRKHSSFSVVGSLAALLLLTAAPLYAIRDQAQITGKGTFHHHSAHDMQLLCIGLRPICASTVCLADATRLSSGDSSQPSVLLARGQSQPHIYTHSIHEAYSLYRIRTGSLLCSDSPKIQRRGWYLGPAGTAV